MCTRAGWRPSKEAFFFLDELEALLREWVRLLTLFVLDRAADQRGTSTFNGGEALAIQ